MVRLDCFNLSGRICFVMAIEELNMFYMLKPNVLYRQHGDIGYITDNALFGYRVPNDDVLYPGERYVSASGAVMLRMLNKKPKCVDTVVKEIGRIYVDVDCETIKHDVTEFYDLLVDDGFLACGRTYEECVASLCQRQQLGVAKTSNRYQPNIDCIKNSMSQSETLKGVHIELATECNERCAHCYIPHKYKVKKIDVRLVNRLLDEAKGMGVLNITLSGGEPLLHEDFSGILRKCREFDFSVNVLSNLTLLTDELLDVMRDNPLLSVQTSVYSMTDAVHDTITGVKGSFNKTMKGLQKLQSVGIPVQISCPVMKINQDMFADVVSFGENNGIQVATEFVIFASLDNTGCNLGCRLSVDDIKKAFDSRANDEYVANLMDMAKEKIMLGAQDPICSICRYYICVAANGTVYPCPGWQNKVVGDLNRQTIKEIWESSCVKELRDVKLADFKNCLECPDRGYCNICMMSNSNESRTADSFKIDGFHCQVASLLHKKIDAYVLERKLKFEK